MTSQLLFGQVAYIVYIEEHVETYCQRRLVRLGGQACLLRLVC
jgi:hypothetical protein